MEKICQNKGKYKYCKGDFEVTQEDFAFYDKMKVPPPTFCPPCRAIRRMVYRNEKFLHHRTCYFTGNTILSIFSEESGIKVVDPEYWRSDKFDAADYYTEYTFNKSFFEQFSELEKEVPLPSLALELCVDSPYNHYCTNLTSCYFCFRTHRSKNTFYSYNCRELENCSDCYDVNKSENLYQCVDTHQSSHSSFLEKCEHISLSHFLYNCKNCFNCFMSSNLSGKQYVFRNKQLTKEAYEKEIGQIDFISSKEQVILVSEFEFLKQNIPYNSNQSQRIVNSKGLFLRECKNTFDSYYAKECEDIKYGYFCNRFKESYDIYAGSGNQVTYETAGVGHNNTILFSIQTTESHNVEYSTYCDYCHDIFGCIGLQNKSYCILNKQYTKEEYFELIPKIKEHMLSMPYRDKEGRIYSYGEFFPVDLSPFCYNETVAYEYFSLVQQEANNCGLKWYIKKPNIYTVTQESSNLDDLNSKNTEDIVNAIIECRDQKLHTHNNICSGLCPGAYKITNSEISLYKLLKTGLPYDCPQCRLSRRILRRNSINMHTRQCMCTKEGHAHGRQACSVQFESAFSPDRKEIVLCEKCYQQEVI